MASSIVADIIAGLARRANQIGKPSSYLHKIQTASPPGIREGIVV